MPQPSWGQPVRGPAGAPVYAQPAKPSSWPMVIGVISIVLGSLGLVCTPLSLAMKGAMKDITPAHAEQQEMFPAWFEDYGTYSSFIGIGVATVLLIAGICTVRRRPAGRTLHLTYAVIACISSVVGLVVLLTAISQIDLGDMGPAERARMRGGLIGGAVGSLFGVAYPVFLLVWFFRSRIRQEVETWRSSPWIQSVEHGR